MFLFVFIPAIMRFMGDAPLKGQHEQDLVTTVLKVLTSTLVIRKADNIKCLCYRFFFNVLLNIAKWRTWAD